MRRAGVKVRYWRKGPVVPGGRPIGAAAGRGSALRLVACAVVVFVVGMAGSASAAVLIGSRQVQDGSLTGRDLKAGTVRGSDVRDGSLTQGDFGVVPKGPTGPTGPDGPRGAAGNRGIATPLVTRTLAAGSTTTYAAPCTAPQKAVFGGIFAAPLSTTHVLQSAPADDGSAWVFVIKNSSGSNQLATLLAKCVTDR